MCLCVFSWKIGGKAKAMCCADGREYPLKISMLSLCLCAKGNLYVWNAIRVSMPCIKKYPSIVFYSLSLSGPSTCCMILMRSLELFHLSFTISLLFFFSLSSQYKLTPFSPSSSTSSNLKLIRLDFTKNSTTTFPA